MRHYEAHDAGHGDYARLPPLAGPLREKKFAPILAHNDLCQARRVLDVGCGPGTNTSYFSHTYYLGIDHNLRYLQHARRRHRRDFLVADVTRLGLAPEARFDFILINSFLHHMDTPNARRLLSQLSALLTEDGQVHILDLVLPAQPSVARLLARLDRGEFPRPLGEWEQIFTETFETEVFEPYELTGVWGDSLGNGLFQRKKEEMNRPFRLSVAVPLYNEESVLPELLRRTGAVLESLAGGPHEIVLVDDGSSDRTLEILEAEAAHDPRIVVVALSRNFGHQAALTAALDHCSGDAVVVMDADLQDPPEAIPRFVEKYQRRVRCGLCNTCSTEGSMVVEALVFSLLPPTGNAFPVGPAA